jgi:nucleoid-associated protein YgaU
VLTFDDLVPTQEFGLTVATGSDTSLVSSSLTAAQSVALTQWSGTEWVVIPSTITTNPNGKLKVVGSVRTAGLLSVMQQPARPLGNSFPPAGGFQLAVWSGLTGTGGDAAANFLPATPGGAIYVLENGTFKAYIVGAPAVTQSAFTLNNKQAIIVRSGGQAPAPAASVTTPPASTPAAPTGSTPSAAARTVTVASGDTLTAIGARVGVDYLKIAAANNLQSPYVLQIGQVLTIPAS